MSQPISYLPEGFHAVTPYLVVTDGDEEIRFLREAFGAVEEHRSSAPDGRLMHAQLRVHDSKIMLGQGNEQWPPMPASLYLYVEDCDAVYARALAAGGTSVMEVADQFYGDRHGGVEDPNGNIWWIATHIEDVGPEELERRMKEAMG